MAFKAYTFSDGVKTDPVIKEAGSNANMVWAEYHIQNRHASANLIVTPGPNGALTGPILLAPGEIASFFNYMDTSQISCASTNISYTWWRREFPDSEHISGSDIGI
jgi:hypothetical protein